MASHQHTGITPAVLAYKAPDPIPARFEPPRDRAFFANPKKTSLLSAASKVSNITPYIGTELSGIQLGKLTDEQKDELALLAAEVSFSCPHIAVEELQKDKNSDFSTARSGVLSRSRSQH